jgi:hypothetical protein
MAGRRLNRRAVTCSTTTTNTMAVAGNARTPPLMLSALTIPIIEANPTISVIAISVEEKAPETTRAQPSRNIQMADISRSQKKKHGSAVHLLQPERRMLRTMAIHSGHVCTMCRMIPCDTAPTTSNAAIIETQQRVKMRKSRSKSHLTESSLLLFAPAVSQPTSFANG